jgi:hypothetical protein
MKMQFVLSHRLRVGPTGTTSLLSSSILLIVACVAFVPCSPVAAENGRVQAAPAGDERPADRRRWWLNIWAHSMQETCFIAWMDAEFGGNTWQWVLPVEQVNSIYLWWSVAVWGVPNGK